MRDFSGRLRDMSQSRAFKSVVPLLVGGILLATAPPDVPASKAIVSPAYGLFRDTPVPKRIFSPAAEKGLIARAKSGYAESEAELGRLLRDSQAGPQSLADAAAWFQRASDHGSMRAAYDLAVQYIRGQGVPKDLGQGVKLIRKSAEGGYAEAQASLGGAYALGMEVPQDWSVPYTGRGKLRMQATPWACTILEYPISMEKAYLLT